MNNIITDKLDFPQTIRTFERYEPVKVAKNLKQDYMDYLNSVMSYYDVWTCTIYPLKKSYKFLRTKNKQNA